MVLLGRIFNQYLFYVTDFVEVLLVPIEDAGNFHFLLVRQKLVQVVSREPCPVGGIDLLIKLLRCVRETLEWRTTSGRTD